MTRGAIAGSHNAGHVVRFKRAVASRKVIASLVTLGYLQQGERHRATSRPLRVASPAECHCHRCPAHDRRTYVSTYATNFGRACAHLRSISQTQMPTDRTATPEGGQGGSPERLSHRGNRLWSFLPRPTRCIGNGLVGTHSGRTSPCLSVEALLYSSSSLLRARPWR